MLGKRFVLALSGLVVSGVSALGDTAVYQARPFGLGDLWTSSYYDYGGNGIINDGDLKVGGWGDIYCSYISFVPHQGATGPAAVLSRMGGLPSKVTKATLQVYTQMWPERTPTPMSLGRVTKQWSETWTSSAGYGPQSFEAIVIASVPAPAYGSWFNIDITNLYKSWAAGSFPNYGLRLCPTQNQQNMNGFASSDHADRTLRPKLRLEYTATQEKLSMPLPLPGGKSWLLTTEAGGRDCSITNPSDEYFIDEYHTDSTNTFFSLDFTNRTPTSSSTGEATVPILSPVKGFIYEIGYQASGNGHFVRIDHDPAHPEGSDGSAATGFQITLAHFKDIPKTRTGTALGRGKIDQGKRVGVMGSTGRSTNTHLHMTIRYRGNGKSNVENLAQMKIEGLLPKSYGTECKNGVRVAYYRSNNIEK